MRQSPSECKQSDARSPPCRTRIAPIEVSWCRYIMMIKKFFYFVENQLQGNGWSHICGTNVMTKYRDAIKRYRELSIVHNTSIRIEAHIICNEKEYCSEMFHHQCTIPLRVYKHSTQGDIRLCLPSRIKTLISRHRAWFVIHLAPLVPTLKK